MKKPQTFAPIRREFMGENNPSVSPGEQPELYGTARLDPVDPVEVRTFQTFTLTYTVGRLGLDDTGAIRVSFRVVTDAGFPQSTDPKRANYVSAKTNGAGTISVEVAEDGPRPWNLTVTARLNGGYLNEGDQIVLIFGDTSQGSPGMLMQTFAEHTYEFKVATDVQATGNYLPLPEQFIVPVVAGPATKWVAVLPTLRRVAEPFAFGLKAEDNFGNPTDQAMGRIRLEPSLVVEGLPTSFDYIADDRALTFEDLKVSTDGVLSIAVYVDEQHVCTAGPLVIKDSGFAHFWGDLHGQTGETVGVNTIESYFDFARNKAFLDVSSHQGNDFQITPKFWDHLNDLTALWNEPGRFTVFPGYEWSGNTAVGGDHNVFFAQEGQQIVRCSHALIEDRSETQTDALTLTDLFDAMTGTDTVIYGHVGGRYCNVHYDHDPVLETAVEVHSAWGTFEWVLTDSLELGRRIGVVCNSDGHKGRPGASYPGASTFGAYGGLTCFLTDKNDRASIMEAQRRRHHYGTTGCRMYMEVEAALPPGSVVYTRDPRAESGAEGILSSTAIMGDIAAVAGTSVRLDLDIKAHSGIERIEIRRGKETIETVRPFGPKELGHRFRLLMSGAEYRGRGRDTRWSGRAIFSGASIKKFRKINHWNTERILETRGSNSVVFDTITTGNFTGFDVWLDAEPAALFEIRSNHGAMSVPLNEVGSEPSVMEAGGLERKITLQRLPEDELPRSASHTSDISLLTNGDTPIWICVTTEDGFQAWSSPIYVYPSL